MNIFVIFCAKYLLFVSLFVGVIFWLRSNKQIKKAVLSLGIASSVVALVLTEILSRLINDPRPFVVKNIQPLIEHAADNGFPSDHTLVAALIGFTIYHFNNKVGAALLILSLVIGFSRIAAQVHHPLDIVGAIAIALVSVSIAKKISPSR